MSVHGVTGVHGMTGKGRAVRPGAAGELGACSGRHRGGLSPRCYSKATQRRTTAPSSGGAACAWRRAARGEGGEPRGARRGPVRARRIVRPIPRAATTYRLSRRANPAQRLSASRRAGVNPNGGRLELAAAWPFPWRYARAFAGTASGAGRTCLGERWTWLYFCTPPDSERPRANSTV